MRLPPFIGPHSQRIYSAIGRSFAEFGLLRNEEAWPDAAAQPSVGVEPIALDRIAGADCFF